MKYMHLGFEADDTDEMTKMDCAIRAALSDAINGAQGGEYMYVRDLRERKGLVQRGRVMRVAIAKCTGDPIKVGMDPARQRAFFSQTFIARVKHLQRERVLRIHTSHHMKMPVIFIGWHEDLPMVLRQPSKGEMVRW